MGKFKTLKQMRAAGGRARAEKLGPKALTAHAKKMLKAREAKRLAKKKPDSI